MGSSWDAVIVGSGPNGLAAGITLAREGLSVLLLEAKEKIGGGARTEELTLPGFRHDVCSAIHPMGLASPFFQTLPLDLEGLHWIQPPVALAHPLDDGTAALLMQSTAETASTLKADGAAWRSLMDPMVERSEILWREILKPIRIPHNPLVMARFGFDALQSCERLVGSKFRQKWARSLFAGCAAHSILSLDQRATASFGLVLALAGHAVGWPIAQGGSERIIEALAAIFKGVGGEIRTGVAVASMNDLPEARAILFDLSPRQVVAIAGEALPAKYRESLSRFRYGPGVFKVDWALDGPIPWSSEGCRQAGTVHVGGGWEEVAASEAAVSRGQHHEKPFVIVAQQSLFDPSRAPEGKQTGWAYCHVPNGSDVDMTGAIESQIERFAPGFRDRILARHSMSTSAFQTHNANMIGGDIGGGANDFAQVLWRPVARWNPYSTPNRKIYLCSSSTPPGGGVHGMSGHLAARSALRRVFGNR
jgi:phytoene dehydrogenase-like protein